MYIYIDTGRADRVSRGGSCATRPTLPSRTPANPSKSVTHPTILVNPSESVSYTSKPQSIYTE